MKLCDNFGNTFAMKNGKKMSSMCPQLYRAVNIYVALVGIEIWTEVDQISVMAAATDTMNNFLAYRRTSICPNHQNDNAQMITYVVVLCSYLYQYGRKYVGYVYG